MLEFFNGILSRCVRSCTRRGTNSSMPLQITMTIAELRESTPFLQVEISDNGCPFPQDNAVIRSFARSVFIGEYKDLVANGVELHTMGRENGVPRLFQIGYNVRTHQIVVKAMEPPLRGLDSSSMLSFTLPCSDGQLIGGMKIMKFLALLRQLLRQLLMISVLVKFSLKLKGEDLVREFREMVCEGNPEDSGVICVEVHEEDELIEEHIYLKSETPEHERLDPAVSLRYVLFALSSQSSTRQEESLIQDPTGFLDPQILQEASRLHPVNLLWNHVQASEEDPSTSPIVGIGFAKSDRIWRSGRLVGLCGIHSGIQSSSDGDCRLILFDQYGISSKSSEAVLLALEKVRWEMFGMDLKQTTPVRSESALPNEYLMFIEKTKKEENDCWLNTIVLHLWLDSEEEIRVALPLSGLNGVVRNCVEGALLEIKERLKNRMQGEMERKLFLAAESISQSISSVVTRSRNLTLQQRACCTLKAASTDDVPMRMKDAFEEAARNAFTKRCHPTRGVPPSGNALSQRDNIGDISIKPLNQRDYEFDERNPEDWMF